MQPSDLSIGPTLRASVLFTIPDGDRGLAYHLSVLSVPPEHAFQFSFTSFAGRGRRTLTIALEQDDREYAMALDAQVLCRIAIGHVIRHQLYEPDSDLGATLDVRGEPWAGPLRSTGQGTAYRRSGGRIDFAA